MAYNYQAFGILISCEWEVFQLKTVVDDFNTAHDLTIKKGSVPEYGFASQRPDPFFHFQVEENKFWFFIEDLARFLVIDGKTIIVDINPDADIQTVNLYLLGSALGVVLHQRKYTVLHGNAIQFGNKTVVVVAESGVGKSTLAGAFFKQGYNLLADDVCAIDSDGYVQPSYPYLKLWQESLNKLGFSNKSLELIRGQEDKYYFPLNKQFCDKPLQVSQVYVLNKFHSNKVISRRISGSKKLVPLYNHTYRKEYAHLILGDNEFVSRLLSLASSLPVTRILRPQKTFALDALFEFITNDMNNL